MIPALTIHIPESSSTATSQPQTQRFKPRMKIIMLVATVISTVIYHFMGIRLWVHIEITRIIGCLDLSREPYPQHLETNFTTTCNNCIILMSDQCYHCFLFFEQIFSIKHYCACRDRCSPWPETTSGFSPDSLKTKVQLEASQEEQDGKNCISKCNCMKIF